ncbi:MAG TPA: type II toxin-antitoxin system RelE/ParE family toxin [Bradyrhizobium sp.]|nr:type II toxin-antitoxin system RelE/ParE family toxin [Bradyrhizobium sp.]
MNIRYTRRAAKQLDTILAYIGARSPQGAAHLVDRLDTALAIVTEQPHGGQPTSRLGYRRLVLNPYPYVIFYRAASAEIVVHGIRHMARRPV